MERTHTVYVNLSGLAFLQALVGKSAPFIRHSMLTIMCGSIVALSILLLPWAQTPVHAPHHDASITQFRHITLQQEYKMT
jgi:hypothetical protein